MRTRIDKGNAGFLRFVYRWRRYAIFALQYYILEKPRGLDFTMRDLEIPENANEFFNAYSKTNEGHLKSIFEKLPFLEGLHLLDVGSGKGVVLKEAAKYPFQSISGIDMNHKLVEIANRNFQKLHMNQKIRCEEDNALKYEDYGSYNVFFFFNPFKKEILEEVVDKIIVETKNKQRHIYFIYHNPVHSEVIDDRKEFILQYKLYDSMKQYETYIYEGIS